MALEDLVARNMHVRITWRARVLRWNGRKGGTSSGIMSKVSLVQDLAREE